MKLKLVASGLAEWTAAPRWLGGLSFGASTLLRLLDEIDYGMALVTLEGYALFTNRPALAELQSGGPLALLQGEIHAHQVHDHELLRLAIANAGRARRALVTLGQDDKLLSVAVQPFIGEISDAGEVLALLTFGKRPVADRLRIALFARLQGITAAEARVLESLCDGVNPKDIAAQQGVALSTVRSHISSMRVKTHTATIRDLVGRVAALPPVSPAMNSARMGWPKTRGEGSAIESS